MFKDRKIINYLFYCIIISSIIILVVTGFLTIYEDVTIPRCNDLKYNDRDYPCCQKCQEFGYEYLIREYSYGGIGRQGYDNCLCSKDKETIQIW